MEEVILKFAASARAAGMRVSTVEVMDCLRQLPRVDVLDEAQFATVLRSHFAKSRLELARFEHLYHLFFHELREGLDAASMALSKRIETLRSEIMAIEPQMPALAAIADFLAGAPEAYLELLREMQSEGAEGAGGPRGAGANLGGLVRRLPVLRALDRARETTEEFLAAKWHEIHWETRRELKQHVERRLESARRLLTSDMRPDFPLAEIKGAEEDLYGALGRQSFANLSPGEMIRLRDVITKLVRKLRDMASRRFTARSRGLPDIKRTLRAATGTQGIPLALKYRQKAPRRARIVVLCDVSGSVWSSARFMLTVIYALQDCFDRVNSFVFVDEPVEVSSYFDDFDIERALAEVLRCPDITYGASTDYGRMLRLFRDRHMDRISKKTTLIVIGDGRSNYCNPEEGILEEIRSRCRRLLWLNPEDAQFWNSGDSEMRAYLPLCDDIRTCRNLNQLAAFIRDLVL
jgi:uncharacterized protein with von Willebrand factor type A (vWA) domain